MTAQRSFGAYLHRNIKEDGRHGPHKCHELRSGRRDEGSGRLDGRMQARCLGLEAERQIRRRESERVGKYDLFNLLNRRLNDVDEGFQLDQGVLRHASESSVKHLTSAIRVRRTKRDGSVRWVSLTDSEKTKEDSRQRETSLKIQRSAE